VYAVAERRLRPGAWRGYLEAMRELDSYLGRNPHRGPYSLYVSQSDPDLVLGVGLWRRREDLAEAAASLPRPLLARLDSVVDAGQGQREWFSAVRQRRAFAHAPRVFAATRLIVGGGDVGRFREWATEVQDRTIRLPGVVTLQILESEDDPGIFLHLSEYADEAARGRALAEVDATRPRFELLGERRYLGRVGYYWDREEALVESRAS
jgi:quinol monooxygenase YgiN